MVLRLYRCRQRIISKKSDRKMNNQNKLKIAAATLGIAVLVAAVAVPTALALRDDEVVPPDAIIDPDA